MDKRELEAVTNEMLYYVGMLIDGGAIGLNQKAVFNAGCDNGEGVVVIVLRTHRILELAEVEKCFGVSDNALDFTHKRPNLTLVKNDENDH